MEAVVEREKDLEAIEWIKLPFPGCTVKILERNQKESFTKEILYLIYYKQSFTK